MLTRLHHFKKLHRGPYKTIMPLSEKIIKNMIYLRFFVLSFTDIDCLTNMSPDHNYHYFLKWINTNQLFSIYWVLGRFWGVYYSIISAVSDTNKIPFTHTNHTLILYKHNYHYVLNSIGLFPQKCQKAGIQLVLKYNNLKTV